jgi:hypothetical protein
MSFYGTNVRGEKMFLRRVLVTTKFRRGTRGGSRPNGGSWSSSSSSSSLHATTLDDSHFVFVQHFLIYVWCGDNRRLLIVEV